MYANRPQTFAALAIVPLQPSWPGTSVCLSVGYENQCTIYRFCKCSAGQIKVTADHSLSGCRRLRWQRREVCRKRKGKKSCCKYIHPAKEIVIRCAFSPHDKCQLLCTGCWLIVYLRVSKAESYLPNAPEFAFKL